MSITEQIEASGKSREAICEQAGISRSMLSMIEGGDRKASFKTAVALARALGITPAAIRPDMVWNGVEC